MTTCAKCGGQIARVVLHWSTNQEPQAGAFCRPCAKEIARAYPLTPFTYEPLLEVT